jgi:hypothetical protein
MSKLPRILILLGMMGLFATSQVQRLDSTKPAPVLGNPGSAIGSMDELKQYTAGIIFYMRWEVLILGFYRRNSVESKKQVLIPTFSSPEEAKD